MFLFVRRKKSDGLKKLLGVSVILIVLIIILVMSSNKTSEASNNVTNSQNDSNNQVVSTPDTPSDVQKSEPAVQKVVDDELRCDPLVAREGESYAFEGHEIFIDAISKTAVRFSIDDNQITVREGESEYKDVRVSVKQDSLIYIAAGSADNSFTLLIGCGSGEDPLDKYVMQKGDVVCEKLYEQCKEEFDLE